MARQRERAREPHPDPRIEAELQRILSLRLMISGKEALIVRDHEQVASLRARLARHPHWNAASYQREQVDRLLEEIGGIEAEILTLHDEIKARLDLISDVDLTAL